MLDHLLLFLHVTFAVLLIGPTTYATSTFARHASSGDTAAAQRAHRTSKSYGGASGAVAAIGIVLALRTVGFGEVWVDTALTVFLVGIAVLLVGHVPTQATALAQMASEEPVTPATLARLRVTGGVYAITWVAVVWLMVSKPM